MKQYSFTRRRDFYNYIFYKDYYKFLKKELNKYYQHGHTTIYKHVRNVSFMAYNKALKSHKKIDYESLVNAGFMHDLFMYDWHEPTGNHKLHGYTHPKVAAENAAKYCNATPKIQSIIKTHMWPLTITKIPRSKEAWLICMNDKKVAFRETLLRK